VPIRKPFPTTNTNQTGFESQFSDLQAFSACPPSNKRPRTNTGGKQNFNSAAKNKTPLKFDFRSNKPTSNKIIPPVAAAAPATSHQRYISKPVLASQAGQAQQPAAAAAAQDDWGDDDDDAMLFVAVSQVDPSPPSNVAVNEQDLNEMTAQLDDDDDIFDDETLAGCDANMAAYEEDRLNQTVTVFNCPPSQSAPPSQVFKEPPLPPPVKSGQVEVAKMKEEQERLKRLQMKAQGEATYLRSKLGEQSKEIENERVIKRKLEADFKQKLEAEKKVKESEINAIKTEKQFLVQEMMQLKERMRLMENGGTPKSRKVLSQIKVEKNDFPTVKEFNKKDVKADMENAETQTNVVQRRKCRLMRSMDRGMLMAQSFCRVSKAPSQVQARLLLQNTREGVTREVCRMVTQITAEINAALPTPPTPTQLHNITTILSTCGSIILTEHRTAVTETCSNILSYIIKSSNSTLLAPTISMLTMAWSTSLLDPDITAYILSLVSEIIKSVKTVSGELSPSLITSLFSLLVLISGDPMQAPLLCKQSQDCFLTCITMLLYMCMMKTQEVQASACKGLVKWLLHCTGISHPLPWVDNTCKWCTGDIVRTLTLTTQSQVRWRVDHVGREERGNNEELLKDCVTALSRLQDNVRSEQGEETEWIKMVEVAASVQRKYIWTVEHLIKMELGQETTAMLGDLRMETDMDSEGEETREHMEVD